MIEIRQIEIAKGNVLGLKVELPNDSLLMLLGKKGYLACGYLDVKDVEGIGHVVATVSGVSDFNEMIKANVKEVSKNAYKVGVRKGMLGQKALEIMERQNETKG